MLQSARKKKCIRTLKRPLLYCEVQKKSRDFVHSAASLSIGPDFAYKGQVDKTLFFPKPFVLFPEREVGSQNLRGGHPRELLPSKPNTFDSQPNKATF